MVGLFILLFAVVLQAGEIRGRVVDASSGEPLARARVVVLDPRENATTAADGSFKLEALQAGQLTLRAETVGYRVEEKSIQLGSDPVEVEFRLVPDNLTRRDSLEVKADRFEVAAGSRFRGMVPDGDGTQESQLCADGRSAPRGPEPARCCSEQRLL